MLLDVVRSKEILEILEASQEEKKFYWILRR